MRNFFNRIIGTLLILAAIGGLLFSTVSLVAIWRYKSVAAEGLVNGITLLSATLDATAQGLVVTQQALSSSVDTIAGLEQTVRTIATTVQTTQPMVDAVGKMMKEDLPSTVRAVQTSLNTAQQSAAVIDGVLASLESIPFVNVGYKPEVPLSTALGDVSKSMDNLPTAFAAIEDSLTDTSSSIETVQVDMEMMAETIGEVQTTVSQYAGVIESYQASLAQLQQQLEALIQQIPNIVNILVWALTAFLVWMFIAQLGLLTQGWELAIRHPQEDALAAAIAEDREAEEAEETAEEKAEEEHEEGKTGDEEEK